MQTVKAAMQPLQVNLKLVTLDQAMKFESVAQSVICFRSSTDSLPLVR